MSAEHLAALHKVDAFEPLRLWEELPIDHVRYDTLVGEDIEARLAETLTDDLRIVSVVGPSGSGKSSLLATVARDLVARQPMLRIGVGVLSDEVADPAAVSVHIVSRVGALVEDQLARGERRTLSKVLARRETKQRGGGAIRLEGSVELGLKGKVAVELKSAVEAIEREREAADAIRTLEELVRVFAKHDLQPILAIDDTDLWLGRDDRGIALAQAFFSGPVRLLAKELPLSVVIGVHPEYREVQGYKDLAGLIAEFRLPNFPQPKTALAAIFRHRIRSSEVEAEPDAVFSGEALVRLEAEYDHKPRDLRHVLTVTQRALKLVAGQFPDRLEAEHIRAAVQDL